MDVMLLSTVLLGLVATGMSTRLGFLLYKVDHQLSKALAYMVYGGAIAGGVTVAFSLIFLLDLQQYMPVVFATGLRWLTFLSLLGTDIFLYKKYKEIVGDGG